MVTAVAPKTKKPKTKKVLKPVVPIDIILEDMDEHLKYLREFERCILVENKKRYEFEIEGLDIDLRILRGLITEENKNN